MKLLEKSYINDGGFISFYFKLEEKPPSQSNCLTDTSLASVCSGIIKFSKALGSLCRLFNKTLRYYCQIG